MHFFFFLPSHRQQNNDKNKILGSLYYASAFEEVIDISK